jgi:hypothetical protein
MDKKAKNENADLYSIQTFDYSALSTVRKTVFFTLITLHINRNFKIAISYITDRNMIFWTPLWVTLFELFKFPSSGTEMSAIYNLFC